MTPRFITLLCLAGVAPQPQAADDRARLAGERQAITQRFDQEEQACRSKFAATGCLADVRARRRDALGPLRERELSLADQDRQQRAQERRRNVAAKQQAAADRLAALPAPVLTLRQPAPSSPPASAPITPRVVDEAARDAEAAERARRAQAAAQRQAAIEAAIQAAKRRVADRVAARASEGKQVQPLPPLPPLPVSPALPALPASPAMGASQPRPQR